MKKRTLSLLLAVACALSLSGCGGAPAGTGGDEAL